MDFQCLFCLSCDPEKFENAKRKGGGVGGGVQIVLKYLLESRSNKNEGLLRDIRRTLEESRRENKDSGKHGGQGHRQLIVACDECKEEANLIGKLHQELEKTQMKIVYQLKLFREKILKQAVNGTNGEAPPQGLEFGAENGVTKAGGEESVKLLTTIADFQIAVGEKENDSVDVPCIILDKFAYINHLTPEFALVDTEDGSATVKREPEGEIGAGDDIHFEEFPPFEDYMDPVNFDYSFSTEHSSSSTAAAMPKVKLKREMKEADPEYDPQMEYELDEPQQKRYRRSTSSLASGLIPEINTEDGDSSKLARTQKSKKSKKQIKEESLKSKKASKNSSRIRRRFQCELCSFSNITSFRVERHFRTHEADLSGKTDLPAPYACDQCPKSFFFQQYYTFHMEGHQGLLSIECDACKERLPYPDIEAHVKTHTEKIFCCVNCSFCCTKREKFLIHLGHHGTGLWECDLCSKPYRSKGSLTKHLFEEHQFGKKYVCDFETCRKEYHSLDQLRIHKNIHTSPHVCRECGKAYATRSCLQKHQRSHTGELRYRCSDCSEAFITGMALNSHRMLAHGAPKYKCEYCDKEYMSNRMLQAHRTIHEGTGIPCGKCDKILTTKDMWRRHQITHTTDLSFVCEECGKGFTSQEGLKRHSVIHKGENKFKCQFCEKAFLCKQYLENHERTHTGERPFICKFCGKGFTQRGSRSLHRRKVHPELLKDSREECPGDI